MAVRQAAFMNFRPEPEGNKMTRREQHVKEKQYKICHTGYSEVLPGGGLPETGSQIYDKESGDVRGGGWMPCDPSSDRFPDLVWRKTEYQLYNGIVTGILFITVLFANFAESVAEDGEKPRRLPCKKTKQDTKARLLLSDGSEKIVSASELKKGVGAV